MSTIVANPEDRVSDALKEKLKQQNTRFDVHGHIFDFKAVPDEFLGIRLPMNKYTFRLLGLVLPWYRRFLRYGAKNRISIARDWFAASPLSEETIYCPLMMDLQPKSDQNGTLGVAGKIQMDYPAQIEDMKHVRELYNDRLLPFVAIDPRRQKVIETVFNKAFSPEYRFFGVKIYPSLGFMPSDKKLMEIFKMCADYRIPVITHCAGARTHSSNTRIRYNRLEPIPGTEPTEYRRVYGEKKFSFFRKKEYGRFFNGPELWEPVLQRFENLRLCFAHFGGIKQWNCKCGDLGPRPLKIIELMKKYNHVYADFSYNLSHKVAVRNLLNRLSNPHHPDHEIFWKRTLYGTDFYMVTIEHDIFDIKQSFAKMAGDRIMNQIARENPRRFLSLNGL